MNTINQNKTKEPSYVKLRQEETSTIVTKVPNRTISIDKIEVLSSEIVTDLPLIENKRPSCFKGWMCFWGESENSEAKNDFVHPSAVYQPTTTTIIK